MASTPLEIRLLGSLEVRTRNKNVALPRSRKARALLAYLAATGRWQRREALCDLFWEGTADPRAELRWCLSRLRRLEGLDGSGCLESRGESLRLDSERAWIDAHEANRLLAQGVESLSDERLEEVAAWFRGPFLSGLEPAGCLRFDSWLTPERSWWEERHHAVLRGLVTRFSREPDKALPYARRWVNLDPLSEGAHASLMQTLAQLGRTQAALEQFDLCREMLQREFRSAPSEATLALRRKIASRPGVVGGETNEGEPRTTEPKPQATLPPLAGRKRECNALDESLRAFDAGAGPSLLLVLGVAGIGKTRLLQELERKASERGCAFVAARAFDVEFTRPFGPWREVFEALGVDSVPERLKPALSPLLPRTGESPPPELERHDFFAAAAEWLGGVATEEGSLVISFDDVHALDEGSAALLHFLVRSLAGRPLFFAVAAREAEMENNEAVRGMVASLRGQRFVTRAHLEPLNEDETRRLIRHSSEDRGTQDERRIFEQSRGNPLFALELARVDANRSARDDRALEELIRERLTPLPRGPRELVPWAAALGKPFDIEVLARLTGTAEDEILESVEDLAARGILQGAGGTRYEFAHDLVSDAAWKQVSAARRSYMHKRIALDSFRDGDPPGEMAGEAAFHAGRANEPELAARACALAAAHALRMGSNEQASQSIQEGQGAVDQLGEEERLPLQLRLFEVLCEPGMEAYRPPGLEDRLHETVRVARRLGERELERTGLYHMSALNFQRDDFRDAFDATLRAEEVARTSDPAELARGLSQVGSCYAMIGREMARAERLARQAHALVVDYGLPMPGCRLPLALGMVHQHAGRYEEARTWLEAAAEASQKGDDYPWWEYYCHARLPVLFLEMGKPEEAARWCRTLEPLAQAFPEGSEPAFAEALQALCEASIAGGGVTERLRNSLDALRALDSRALLSYVAHGAALRACATGSWETARRLAYEAREAADTVCLPSAKTRAAVVLARAALAQDSPEEARRLVEGALSVPAEGEELSALAREEIDALRTNLSP